MKHLAFTMKMSPQTAYSKYNVVHNIIIIIIIISDVSQRVLRNNIMYAWKKIMY